MLSLSRLARVIYVLSLSLAVWVLLGPARSEAQFGVSGGYRGTPALPTIAIPIISSGSASGGGSGSGIRGFGGGGGFASGSFSTTVIHFNLNEIVPNGGRILTLPPATMMPSLNNLLYADFLFSPFTSDTSGAPWAALLALNAGGGLGISGMIGGIGGFGGGGMGGMGGMGMRGGMGGFAGKGMGGFNGKKPL